MLWSSHDVNFFQLLGFPGDWSLAYKPNNLGITVGGFGGGSCTANNCGGAVQYRITTQNHR
ncbi:MAG: hypothetical protein ABSG77_15660 [Candidatus Acidiferrum sp.]